MFEVIFKPKAIYSKDAYKGTIFLWIGIIFFGYVVFLIASDMPDLYKNSILICSGLLLSIMLYRYINSCATIESLKGQPHERIDRHGNLQIIFEILPFYLGSCLIIGLSLYLLAYVLKFSSQIISIIMILIATLNGSVFITKAYWLLRQKSRQILSGQSHRF